MDGMLLHEFTLLCCVTKQNILTVDLMFYYIFFLYIYMLPCCRTHRNRKISLWKLARQINPCIVERIENKPTFLCGIKNSHMFLREFRYEKNKISSTKSWAVCGGARWPKFTRTNRAPVISTSSLIWRKILNKYEWKKNSLCVFDFSFQCFISMLRDTKIYFLCAATTREYIWIMCFDDFFFDGSVFPNNILLHKYIV